MITEAIIEQAHRNMDLNFPNQVQMRRNGESHLEWRLSQECLCGEDAVEEYLDTLERDQNGLTLIPLDYS